MRKISFPKKHLLDLFREQKVATIAELKEALGTNSSMTIFRKLKELNYLSSCSHSGKYYTLKRFAKFNTKGLWVFKSVLFSLYGTLAETLKVLIGESEQGYSSLEIEEMLQIKPNEPLLELIKSKSVCREKISGHYVYYSNNHTIKRQQVLMRKRAGEEFQLCGMKPNVLMNELKAAIIIFFSILNEKQRRLYAGLESMKVGSGGDKAISDLLGLNIKTVTKGRQELLDEKINIDTIRNTGGGRNTIKKNSTHNR
jgi:hypothetical protein